MSEEDGLTHGCCVAVDNAVPKTAGLRSTAVVFNTAWTSGRAVLAKNTSKLKLLLSGVDMLGTLVI